MLKATQYLVYFQFYYGKMDMKFTYVHSGYSGLAIYILEEKLYSNIHVLPKINQSVFVN